MARVTYVKSARITARPRTCVTCGYVVQPGEPYKHASLKTGPYSSITRVWCKNHTPKQSQLTTNDRMSRLYAVEEDLDDSIAAFKKGTISLDDLKSDFENQADEVESVADEYEESADNMPENLQYGSQAEEMRNKASSIREWADALRGVDWPDYDLEKCDHEDGACGEPEDAPVHDAENEEAYDHDFEEPERPDVSDAESVLSELSI